MALPILLPFSLRAQPSSSSWTRGDRQAGTDSRLFHSTFVLGQPTTEGLAKGNWEFEISHRFIPPVSEGMAAFYGFDGPANMRLGLGWAIAERWLLRLARSNVLDNVDLSVKYRVWDHNSRTLPVAVALSGGLGWVTDPEINRPRNHKRNLQYYARVIANTKIKKKLGLGLITSLLFNSDVFSAEQEEATTLGAYAQYPMVGNLSLAVELQTVFNLSPQPPETVAVGLELATGGHFFKVFATNSSYLNPSQYLAGAENSTRFDEARLGFLITRILGS